MTISATARHGFPLLSAGQAQKEVMHNEALLLADFLINPVAEELARDTPPEAPLAGQAWIVGGAPTGAWIDRVDQIACWTVGGWRYVAPFEGMHVWLRGAELWAVRGESAWAQGVARVSEVQVAGMRVLGTRQPMIAEPTGGSVVDDQARGTVTAILIALRAHGLISV
ncbi:DUF2793 domain-containing protein [Sphingomonas cavernae]|uniref:DUF2793 domain-containing protein n=1 Tax=Sphingomonas cavernae TaxID=2320861 RepID=A0A418WL70_9SPHN|nr:DUF2793 domain-containing protein [Sphingomonas cavernae]RJF90794.1 DUF2793 domain-containing protein [Sphingomonas cavernae]